MQRREFIKSVIALGGGLAAGPAFSQQAPPDGEVKRVLVMFKCHFDAGFIDTQAAVVHRYFTSSFPRRSGGRGNAAVWFVPLRVDDRFVAALRVSRAGFPRGSPANGACRFQWRHCLARSSL